MAYYCGECAVWVGSSDVDRYGRRWCAYSRRYEESNQNTYGCRGFVYNGRTVLTKICEILHEPTEQLFEAYDAVKESFAAPEHMEWLSAYCNLGPKIADRLDADVQRNEMADMLMKDYIQPAYMLWKDGKNEESALTYKQMVACLAQKYCCE